MAAYRDIRASAAPPSVKHCWQAIACLLPDSGQPVVLTYKQIAAHAKCKKWTAKRSIAFGVELGIIERVTTKRNLYRGDFWNEPNRYTWIGPPSAPIKRGQWRAFARARKGMTSYPEVERTSYPICTESTQSPERRERTPTVDKVDARQARGAGAAHRVVASMGMGGQCEVCGVRRPTGRCYG